MEPYQATRTVAFVKRLACPKHQSPCSKQCHTPVERGASISTDYEAPEDSPNSNLAIVRPHLYLCLAFHALLFADGRTPHTSICHHQLYAAMLAPCIPVQRARIMQGSPTEPYIIATSSNQQIYVHKAHQRNVVRPYFLRTTYKLDATRPNAAIMNAIASSPVLGIATV